MSPRPVACVFRLVALLCLASLATVARADFASALADLEAGRYEPAAREFERLAWLGLAPAQSNIAVLYANGQGVNRSPGKAAAWARIASQSGDPKARDLYFKILPMLSSADVDESVALERAYQAVALELQVDFDKPMLDGTPAKRLSKMDDIYPPAALSEGWEGYAYLLFVVDEQGKPRDVQVLISAPPGKFDAATVESVLGARWEPASHEGSPVSSLACLHFVFQFGGVGDTQGVAKMVRQLRERADGGDVSSQFAGAVLKMAYPDAASRISEEEAQRWMVAALEARFPLALLMAWTCGIDQSYGERAREIARSFDGKDLLTAARRGSSPAQVLVARELLAAEHLDLAARTRRAIGWLELAEAGPQAWQARIKLAHLLATTPVAELRDPERARSLYQPLRRTWGFHPLVKETAAALK